MVALNEDTDGRSLQGREQEPQFVCVARDAIKVGVVATLIVVRRLDIVQLAQTCPMGQAPVAIEGIVRAEPAVETAQALRRMFVDDVFGSTTCRIVNDLAVVGRHCLEHPTHDVAIERSGSDRTGNLHQHVGDGLHGTIIALIAMCPKWDN